MIGRLTSTPELHKTNNDKSVARATIAVNRRYKDQNGEREADFVNLVLWENWLKPWQATQLKVVLSLWMENFVLVALRKWPDELCD